MKKLVLDASVIIKWLLPDVDQEEDTKTALDILQNIKESEISINQPVHWLAEAAAVAVRLTPETARKDIADLCEMDFDIIDNLEVYLLACDLSAKLNHHMFDTLYHAVAIHLSNTVLVTADRKYYKKASPFGKIVLLEQFKSFPGRS